MKRTLAIFTLCVAPVFAQLSPEQKAADLRQIAALYNKQYAPYEWKRSLFDFDLLNLKPWLDRAAATTNDLDYYEILVEYVASLHDTHDAYSLPSDFVARSGMSADIYDGKVLIESIDRFALPVRDFPFVVGDEIVSVDGKTAEELLTQFEKYSMQGNPRSTRRIAAARIVTRPQSRMPHAVDVGDSSTFVIRRANGNVETYTIPWVKTGTPLHVGSVPTLRSFRASSSDIPVLDEDMPDYLKTWVDAQYSGVSEDVGLLNYGSRTPIFALPAGFVQRLGRVSSDFFYSGTYTSDGVRIGYIRIPNYGSLAATVQQQFDDEIVFMQANTDGLIIDEMRNTGGFLCFGENIMTRLVPYPFQAIGYELRATRGRLNSFYNSLNNARNNRAEQWIIDTYQSLYDAMRQAYSENRGLTGPVPLCPVNLSRGPAVDRNGKSIAYAKPIIMLVDEFSTSTADSVPAMFQDAARGPILGWRTNGAGGTNTTFASGNYSEGSAGMTLGLMNRPNAVSVNGYPTTTHIENVGVQPDITVDYMTRDNLVQAGRPFVEAFTAEIVKLVQKK
jgi:hypothetical protein